MGPCTLGSKEIDGLLVLPGKACRLLTDHLIIMVISSGLSLHRKSGKIKPSIHISLIGLVGWLY